MPLKLFVRVSWTLDLDDPKYSEKSANFEKSIICMYGTYNPFNVHAFKIKMTQ